MDIQAFKAIGFQKLSIEFYDAGKVRVTGRQTMNDSLEAGGFQRAASVDFEMRADNADEAIEKIYATAEAHAALYARKDQTLDWIYKPGAAGQAPAETR